jgi:hypothetical protein
MFPYYTHTQYTTTPAVPTFLLHLNVRGNLVDTIKMDSQEDLDLVVAYAQEVRDRGRAERAPITVDMLPYLKQTIIDAFRVHVPMAKPTYALRKDRERPPGLRVCPRVHVHIEALDMNVMQ